MILKPKGVDSDKSLILDEGDYSENTVIQAPFAQD